MGFLCFGRHRHRSPSPVREDAAPVSTPQESIPKAKKAESPINSPQQATEDRPAAGKKVKLPGRKSAPLATPKLAIAARRTEGSSREKIQEVNLLAPAEEQEPTKVSLNEPQSESPKETVNEAPSSRPESPAKYRPSSPRSLTSPKPAPIGPMGLRPIFAIDQQDELKKALARRFKKSEGNDLAQTSNIPNQEQGHPQTEETFEK